MKSLLQKVSEVIKEGSWWPGGVVVVISGLGGVEFFRYLFRKAEIDPTLVATVTVVAAAATGLGATMLRYLRSDPDRDAPRERRTISRVEDRLSALEGAAGFGRDTMGSLLTDMRSKLSSELAEDFEHSLRERYAPAMEALERTKYVRSLGERTLARLQTEIRALMRRGNLNLVLGTLTTSAAALMLAYVAFTAHLAIDDWHRYVPMYLVRLSVAAFIEVFAFFFLRLYRTSLSEIKYFQNEMTNLEAKCLALELSVLSDNRAAADKVIEELAHTERNFVLKKDETTIDLEKARLDSQHLRDLLATIRDVVPSVRRKSD